LIGLLLPLIGQHLELSSYLFGPLFPGEELGLIAHENVFMLRIKFALEKPSSFGQTERKRCKFASIKNGSSTLSNCKAIAWAKHWKKWEKTTVILRIKTFHNASHNLLNKKPFDLGFPWVPFGPRGPGSINQKTLVTLEPPLIRRC